MVPLHVVVGNILRDDEAKVALAERDDPGQAFGLDGPDEPFRVGVQVRAAGRQSNRFDPTGLEDPFDLRSEQRIAVVDQIPCLAQKPVAGNPNRQRNRWAGSRARLSAQPLRNVVRDCQSGALALTSYREDRKPKEERRVFTSICAGPRSTVGLGTSPRLVSCRSRASR